MRKGLTLLPCFITTSTQLLYQAVQLGAEARGLGFISMHDGVFKQRIQPLDLLNLSAIARKSEGGSYLSAEALA